MTICVKSQRCAKCSCSSMDIKQALSSQGLFDMKVLKLLKRVKKYVIRKMFRSNLKNQLEL